MYKVLEKLVRLGIATAVAISLTTLPAYRRASAENIYERLANVPGEVIKSVAEPVVRVDNEYRRGNPLAPLYATRGMVNGLVRGSTSLVNVVTPVEYSHKVGEDNALANTRLWEGAIIAAPFAAIHHLFGLHGIPRVLAVGGIGGLVGIVVDEAERQ